MVIGVFDEDAFLFLGTENDKDRAQFASSTNWQTLFCGQVDELVKGHKSLSDRRFAVVFTLSTG